MSGRQRVLFALLTACVVLVLAWEIMVQRSRAPFKPFELTGEQFRAFAPAAADWVVSPVAAVVDDPTAPNIFSFFLAGRRQGGGVTVRLVHGYNMPVCMKIKGYTVQLLEDDLGGSGRQTWRVTSGTRHVSIWVTQMLDSGDMRPTGKDIRVMAFPRVGTPDDPNWVPGGFSPDWVRHPVRNIRNHVRAKWNASRCDWPTFLGLRQPAWASAEDLVLVAASRGPSVDRGSEAEAVVRVTEAHAMMVGELQRFWREGRGGGTSSGVRPPAGAPAAP